VSDPAEFRARAVVEAVRYQPHLNCADVAQFVGDTFDPDGCDGNTSDPYFVPTADGDYWARPGDWIVREPGGLRVYRPDDFDAAYEPAARPSGSDGNGTES
jgi:hypothetical protein